MSGDGSSPRSIELCRPFTSENHDPEVMVAVRGLDMRRGSLTLRERGPHARRHLIGFCSSTFKDQRTSTPAGAESRTPRAMTKAMPPSQQPQRVLSGDPCGKPPSQPSLRRSGAREVQPPHAFSSAVARAGDLAPTHFTRTPHVTVSRDLGSGEPEVAGAREGNAALETA